MKVKTVLFATFTFFLSGCGGREIPVTPVPGAYLDPYKYIGENTLDVAKSLKQNLNPGGNIAFDQGVHHFYLESTQGKITYVEVTFNETAPCDMKKYFNSHSILAALGVDSDLLDLQSKDSHLHIYYDHKKILKIRVTCQTPDNGYSVSFSRKYYGD